MQTRQLGTQGLVTSARRLVPPATVLLVLLAGACGHPRRAEPAPMVEPSSAQARLEVTNRSTADVDVFLERSDQRIRLGLAPAGRITRFSVGSSQLAGAGTVRFLAVPIGAVGRSAASDPVSVRTGDVIALDVPPQ